MNETTQPVDRTRVLIAAACLCIIGWTVYLAGSAFSDRLEQRRYARATEKAWLSCMSYMPDIEGSLNNSHENRTKRCLAKGYSPQ